MLKTSNSEIKKGFASEYKWDGLSVDGSGKTMKDDPRVVIFDNFTDYDGNLSTHIKGGEVPKRWIGSGQLYFDWFNKFSGDYSLRINIPQSPDAAGGGILQWLDTNALRGLPMNDEEMTGIRGSVPENPDILPVYPEIKHKEGGYTELYARTMIMYADNYDRYGHSGIGFSGGYRNAGYRSNGYDSMIAGVEPENTGRLPVPGSLNIYYYGPEQVGKHGNHMYPDGVVNPSTGGDNENWVFRYDGVNGFKSLPKFVPPLGKWFSLELYVKLNTVIKNGTSPGPNPHESVPYGQYPLGPQPKPDDCEIVKDGEIKVWVDGDLVMDYNDVVFRYSDTVIIDKFNIGLYYGSNGNPPTGVWYDNLVIATEYIGPVNTSGNDPWITNTEKFVRSANDGANNGRERIEIANARITQYEAYIEKGRSVQFKANTEINALKYGKTGEYCLPDKIELQYNNSQIVKMPGNGACGCDFDWGNIIKPDGIISVYYDSPYSIEHTKKCLKAIVRNERLIPWTEESWVYIRAWDPENKYFQLFYNDFVDLFNGSITDFSKQSVGELTLAVTVFIPEKDGAGEYPITVTKVEFGDIDKSLLDNIHAVPWFVAGSEHKGTKIDKNGLLTVSKDETAELLVISVKDDNAAASASVKLTVLYADIKSMEIMPPEFVIAKGKSQKFDVKIEINSPLVYTKSCGFKNLHWRLPASLENIEADSLNMPLNGLWGHLFNLGSYVQPDCVLRVYYDSPYSREFTMDWLKIGSGFNSRHNLFKTKFDEDNTYFDVSYDDFAEHFNSRDMSAAAIGEQLLSILIHNDNAAGQLIGGQPGSGGNKGPIKINKVEFGTLKAYMPDGISEVKWSVSGNNSAETIINDGILAVSNEETASTITVKAESVYNTGFTGISSVTIK